MSAVEIETGCRLHFGPLSYRPEAGRHFGGIGLMIDAPGVSLQLSNASTGSSRSPEAPSSRACAALHDICCEATWEADCHLRMMREIPPHCGLGSGTQLRFALAEALLALRGHNYSTAHVRELANRGERSAIGLHGYQLGGFLVDAGKRPGEATGELAVRVEFPENWRVVLIMAQRDTGLHGDSEEKTFADLAPMPRSTSGELSRLVLTEILPAIHRQDLAGFQTGIHQYGQLVGSYFAPCQGGTFSHPALRALATTLPPDRLRGLAQSSWGPTAAMFVESDAATAAIEEIKKACPELSCHVSRPRNTGRTIQISSAKPT